MIPNVFMFLSEFYMQEFYNGQQDDGSSEIDKYNYANADTVSSLRAFCTLCVYFYDLSAWGGCWFVVYIRRFF